MVFTSYLFPAFLLLTILVYFIMPAKARWVVLLLFSIIFYAIAGIEFIPFILAAAIISFLAALYIDNKNIATAKITESDADKEEKRIAKDKAKKSEKRIVVIMLILILGYLMYTKFAGYIIDSEKVTQIFHSLRIASLSELEIKIIVPLGISYYSFSAIGYVLDVYWKRYSAERNFFRYFLYLIYFPHILQGPIARYDRLGIQMKEIQYFDYDRVCFGAQLMIWGYFQKLVIADRLGIFVKTIFNDCRNQYGFVLLIAVIFYAIQIYADFAGCVNIARGMSQIFGIELEENFRQPYFSKSVEEFWRRWHMTLGAWFKDYLCMPISTSKTVKNLSKKARKKWGSQAGRYVTSIIPVIAVWICTGIWHGTGVNYILWGMWQGGIIIFSILMEPVFAKCVSRLKIDVTTNGWKAFQMIRTFILAGIIPRIITRANSLGDAAAIFKNLFARFNVWVFFDESLYTYGLERKSFWIGMLGIAILIFTSILKERGVSIRKSIAGMNIVLRWCIYLCAIASVVVFGVYGTAYDASSFLYMGF